MPQKIRLSREEVAAAQIVKEVLTRSGTAVPDVVDKMCRVEFIAVPYDPAMDWPNIYPDGGQ